MIVRLYILTAAASLLTLAGCRNDAFLNAQVDTMRSEYLALENDYFALEDIYNAKCQELEACRAGKATKPTTTSTEDGQSTDDTSDDSGSGDFTPPRIDFGTPGAPEIEFGTPVDPRQLQPGDSGAASSSSSDGANVEIPGDVEVLLPSIEEINYVEPTDKHLTHIIINPYLTTGHDFDSKPGDDGISLLIEPRNGDDQLVAIAGKISIVVLDPALEGPAARVARWDFSAEEAARRIKKGDDRQRGVSFKLPWPGNPPEHSKLHVFVRMESDEGKILEADSEFYVILPGQFSQRWTPVSPADDLNQILASQRNEGRYAVVPAEYASDLTAPEAALKTDESPVVKQESATSDRNSPARNKETLSSSQPKRPVWKPYR